MITRRSILAAIGLSPLALVRGEPEPEKLRIDYHEWIPYDPRQHWWKKSPHWLCANLPIKIEWCEKVHELYTHILPHAIDGLDRDKKPFEGQRICCVEHFNYKPMRCILSMMVWFDRKVIRFPSKAIIVPKGEEVFKYTGALNELISTPYEKLPDWISV